MTKVKMTKVTNQYGVEIYFEAAAQIMDDEIREELTVACETEQEFFDAYCKLHEERFGEEFECAKQNPVY